MMKAEMLEDVPEEQFCPIEIEYVWHWFHELDSTRTNGGMSLGAITNVEMTAWSVGMNIKLTPFERRAILELDKTYLQYLNSKDKK